MCRTRFIVLAFAALAGCHKPLHFPIVQKYTSTPGDVFYWRSDGQFVLLERRKALDVRVAPTGEQAYSYPERITVSRRVEPRPGEFLGPGSRAPEILENKELTKTSVPIPVLVFLPVGGRLMGGAADGSLWAWDANGGQVLQQLQDAAEVLALDVSADGKTLAVGLGTHSVGTTLVVNPGRVRLWDLSSGLVTDQFGESAALALAFAADGRLAAGLEDGSVLLRPATGGTPLAIQTSTPSVVSIAWHPAGRVLAIGHRDKHIVLWDLKMGHPLGTLESPLPFNPLFPRGIERLAFSVDGTRLASAFADGEMILWNTHVMAELEEDSGRPSVPH